MSIKGACFCGQVSYQIDGQLRDATSCHCSMCRKVFNAQASAVATLEPSEFRWVSGEHLLTSYISKHGYGVQFCKVCGSTLCTVYKGEVFQVTLGCVDGDPDIEIGRHIFVGSKARWEVMPDGVPQFDQAAEPN